MMFSKKQCRPPITQKSFSAVLVHISAWSFFIFSFSSLQHGCTIKISSLSLSLCLSRDAHTLSGFTYSLGIVAQNSFFLCLPCEFRLSRRAREHRGSSCEHRGVCPWEVRTLWVWGLLFDFSHTPRFRPFFKEKKNESKRKPPDPKHLENQRPPGSKTLGQIKDPPVVSGLLKILGNH